ncbi:Trypsin [Popillia japonica]|uniref:Trypsin n=1 Tax=Popillia japonica TaxID=7064 RepID=A0AAW1NK70_POPJA
MLVSKWFVIQILASLLRIVDINAADDPETRILGGYDVETYKYPWFVALKRMDIVHCGGTLISDNFVVTAAHCFNKFLKAVESGFMKVEDIFTPVLGAYNICQHEDTQREFKIKAIHIHEKYQKEKHFNDIALVELNEPATNFEKCDLPNKAISEDERPKEVFVAGFGDLEWTTIARSMLNKQQADGKALQNAFCAGYLSGSADTCRGDSGGPLFVVDSSGGSTLIGIISFGFQCGTPNTLGVYTDVSMFLDWLTSKIALSESKNKVE